MSDDFEKPILDDEAEEYVSVWPERRRDPQRPLDDFEVRILASGDFEVVATGTRYHGQDRRRH